MNTFIQRLTSWSRIWSSQAIQNKFEVIRKFGQPDLIVGNGSLLLGLAASADGFAGEGRKGYADEGCRYCSSKLNGI